MELLTRALDDGLDLRWVDADEVADDALTICAFSMGSIAPISDEVSNLLQALRVGEPDEDQMEAAISALEAHLGQRVGCVVPAELGAHNSPAAVVAGARLGLKVVDGDYAGRAIPDEMQTTPFAHGKPGTPFSSVDPFGNTAIVTRVANPYMLERVGKMLSIAGVFGTTMAATPLPGREMKEVLVRDTLSLCLEIGRAARQAVESGKDPVDAVVSVTSGWRLFDGVVVHKEWEDRDGYMFGTVEIEGADGDILRVWFKNENHITWLNGTPWVCSPDLVSIINPATGAGFTNTDIAEGDRVSVLGVRGLDVFRTPEMLAEAAGPEYYGFDLEYTPIEDLVAEQS